MNNSNKKIDDIFSAKSDITFDESYYTVKNFVTDAIADKVLAPGEGIQKLIKIESQKDSTQGELLEVIVNADKRKRKGKNPSKIGTIDGIFYSNPKNYLKTAIQKYEEIHNDIMKKERDEYYKSREKEIPIKESREESILTGNASELEKLYQNTKKEYQGGFSDDMFNTISLKYYTLLYSGKLYGRFKNRYRNPDIDKYLEEKLAKQGYNKEDSAQIITSKLYNYYIEELMHKGISDNAMKKVIDKALKNSHEFIGEGNIYCEDVNLCELQEELAIKNRINNHKSTNPQNNYFPSDDAKKNIILWLFENKLVI